LMARFPLCSQTILSPGRLSHGLSGFIARFLSRQLRKQGRLTLAIFEAKPGKLRLKADPVCESPSFASPTGPSCAGYTGCTERHAGVRSVLRSTGPRRKPLREYDDFKRHFRLPPF
jgi:hypothetical protein